MNSKITLALFVVGLIAASVADEVDDAVVTGYAEQLVDCFQSCLYKYGKYAPKKTYPQKKHECDLSCKDKYSAVYGSAGFYPEKQAECRQICDVHYGKNGTKKAYPEKRAECHQRCHELYGYRKQVPEVPVSN